MPANLAGKRYGDSPSGIASFPGVIEVSLDKRDWHILEEKNLLVPRGFRLFHGEFQMLSENGIGEDESFKVHIRAQALGEGPHALRVLFNHPLSDADPTWESGELLRCPSPEAHVASIQVPEGTNSVTVVVWPEDGRIKLVPSPPRARSATSPSAAARTQSTEREIATDRLSATERVIATERLSASERPVSASPTRSQVRSQSPIKATSLPNSPIKAWADDQASDSDVGLKRNLDRAVFGKLPSTPLRPGRERIASALREKGSAPPRHSQTEPENTEETLINTSRESSGRGPTREDNKPTEETPFSEAKTLLESADQLSQREFGKAARICMSLLGKTGQADIEVRRCAVDLLGSLQRASGDRTEDELPRRPEEESEYKEEVRVLTEKLAAAKETSTALRKQKVVLEAQLHSERQMRNDLEGDLASAQIRLQRQMQEVSHLERENSVLRQQRLDAEKLKQENAALKKQLEAKAYERDQEGLGRRIASVECIPLRKMPAAEKQAFKKRIMLKWHPDKQPCPESSELATEVMQELQSHPDWG